jgi:hypothetical protein
VSKRQDLQNILVALLGSSNVYFQPPESIKLIYPCIIYRRDSARTIFADDSPYKNTKRYQITVIDGNPDSGIPDKVAKLPLCSYDRSFSADNLNHDVFNLFF